MTQPRRSRFRATLGKLAVLAALAAAAPGVHHTFAQTLKAGVSETQYSDQYSQNCEQQNADNPYVGMNPMTCHGESAPTDSRGECSLNIGSVWKKDGNTCYYCSPINPPIQGIIIPLDNVGAAQLQGWGCGMDQADACMAICSGGKGFTPPAGTEQKTGGPETPYQPGPSGGPPPGYAPHPGPPPVAGAKNPCLPFGPGGYDYCANPPEARPAECVCPGMTLPSQAQFGAPPCNQKQDSYADVPNAAPQLRYGLGFENGVKNCALSQVTAQNIAVAALAASYQRVATLLTIVAAPSVIQNVLHPPGSSTNPDPYQRGNEEGGRLCQWAITVSPGFMRKCPGAVAPAITKAANTTPTKCTPTQMQAGLNQAIEMAGTYIQKRYDCFLCTTAWLRGDAYTAPANGGATWTLGAIEKVLAGVYGKVKPQGPSLPCERQAAQQDGKVTPMNPAQITAEMEAAGVGAKGYVFAWDPASKTGHVFGVETVNSSKGPQVNFWDPQQEMSGDLWFKPGQWVGFYRIQ